MKYKPLKQQYVALAARVLDVTILRALPNS